MFCCKCRLAYGTKLCNRYRLHRFEQPIPTQVRIATGGPDIGGKGARYIYCRRTLHAGSMTRPEPSARKGQGRATRYLGGKTFNVGGNAVAKATAYAAKKEPGAFIHISSRFAQKIEQMLGRDVSANPRGRPKKLRMKISGKIYLSPLSFNWIAI